MNKSSEYIADSLMHSFTNRVRLRIDGIDWSRYNLEISKETLKLNPAIRSLGNEELQNELLQAVFKLTTDLEVIKKALRKKGGEKQRDL